MSVLDPVLAFLLSAVGIPTALLVLLLVAMRWSFPFSRVGGAILLGGVVGFGVAVAARAPTLFRRLAEVDVAPAVALALGSAAATWVGVRGLRRRASGDGSGGAWTGPDRADVLAVALVVAALLAVAAVAPVPVGPVADLATPPDPIRAPWWAAGWLELSGIVRPPLLFALLSLAALAALPWLGVDPRSDDDDPIGAATALDERRYGVRLFLFGWWILGVGPILVGTWLRGAGWRPLGLDGLPIEGRAWSRSLAELVWIDLLKTGAPTAAVVRELPGLVVLALVLVVLPTVLLRRGRGRGIARRYRRSLGRTRFSVGVLLVLAMVLLALKIWIHELLRLRAFVDLGEIGVMF